MPVGRVDPRTLAMCDTRPRAFARGQRRVEGPWAPGWGTIYTSASRFSPDFSFSRMPWSHAPAVAPSLVIFRDADADNSQGLGGD
jgi:hypothetical protein